MGFRGGRGGISGSGSEIGYRIFSRYCPSYHKFFFSKLLKKKSTVKTLAYSLVENNDDCFLLNNYGAWGNGGLGACKVKFFSFIFPFQGNFEKLFENQL